VVHKNVAVSFLTDFNNFYTAHNSKRIHNKMQSFTCTLF